VWVVHVCKSQHLGEWEKRIMSSRPIWTTWETLLRETERKIAKNNCKVLEIDFWKQVRCMLRTIGPFVKLCWPLMCFPLSTEGAFGVSRRVVT
jgi:hypothetical protein